ncbi:NADH pyrophosphatase [Methylobacterium sp. Leaf123]|uniref:NAD(+) diphosphatase n=1 Tax=Methylobacterium sp. Leaf123 TaxID=1736264 RepID=UPI0007010B9A|nr:NAD(+) diphosphatase [Methylobacterium sp. Leaf123]KQQ23474.1 NADH pyrophosphatase [Methylobacterium sp. Leaf123]
MTGSPHTPSRDALAYAASRLVRNSAEFGSAPALAEGGPDARLVLMAGDTVILRADPAETGTALLTPDEAGRAGERAVEIYLGRVEGRPVFAGAVPGEAALLFPAPGYRALDLRALAAEGAVVREEQGLIATAKSVLAWHARHRFCANCGSPTTIAASGFRRECGSCGLHHFPRTDPVAIMLVRRGESCLLGRSRHFKPGMYSCLAGFIEPGETVEDAVRRETREETGIAVGAVAYHASQPWPFPASLMIGCVAEGLSEAIRTDPDELDDARWLTRAEVAQMIAGTHPEGLTVPPPTAIAHLLMRDWVDGVIGAAPAPGV